MTARTFRSSPPQQVNGWDRKPMDATVRRRVHGKLRPMQEPSWLRRLLGRGR